MIRLEYKRITNGRNFWHICGTIAKGKFVGDIHGDITDGAGIREAFRRLIASKPRYRRAAA